MLTKNLKDLPKVRNRSSYLYVEHARIDQEAKAIAAIDETCTEVGLSRAAINRILARTRQRFAEAATGKTWTRREIKDEWKAAVEGKEGKRRQETAAAADFAVMCAFRSD